MRKLVGIFVALLASALAHAAPTTVAVRTEIEALLGKLESSHCEFNRNGGWHTGADAKTHLLGKLQYLENRTTLRSTEQFIELAASVSSASGKPYLVKCGTNPAVPSAQWLNNELAAIRATGQYPASAPK
jgi:hypothetical protein